MTRILLLLIILTGLSLGNPSFAQAFTLQDEISAYTEGKYQQVINIGHVLTAQNPYDVTSHYYMANAYSYLGQTKDAIEEYSFCDKVTQDSKLKSYCEEALQYLINNQSLTVHTNTSNYSPTNSNFNNLATLNVQAAIQNVQKSASAAIDAIPYYYQDSYGNQIKNPDYHYSVKRIKEQERQNIASIHSDTSGMLTQANLLNNQNSLISYSPSFYMPPQYASYSPPQIPTNLPAQYSSYPAPQHSSMPANTQSSQNKQLDALFNYSPQPPPPFPASAIKGAEHALGQKID